MNLARILRGDTQATPFQAAVVRDLYAKLGLPLGPVEALAGDLTVPLKRREDALATMGAPDAPIDSASVRVQFLNLCQLAGWASAMPFDTTNQRAMDTAITQRGASMLYRLLIWLISYPDEIRPLAPCKSLGECLAGDENVLHWFRGWAMPSWDY